MLNLKKSKLHKSYLLQQHSTSKSSSLCGVSGQKTFLVVSLQSNSGRSFGKHSFSPTPYFKSKSRLKIILKKNQLMGIKTSWESKNKNYFKKFLKRRPIFEFLEYTKAVFMRNKYYICFLEI